VTTFRLVCAAVRHYAGASAAILLGVIVGAAVLTGALLVGDSMRGSLRAMALDRLGEVDAVLVSNRFVRESLARQIATDPRILSDRGISGVSVHYTAQPVAPVITVRGAVTHAERRTIAGGVSVIGMDRRFWGLASKPVSSEPVTAAGPPTGTVGPSPAPPGPPRAIPWESSRSVILNRTLADALGAERGDDVLLRIGKAAAVSAETLMGRRDDATAALRLTVQSVIPSTGLGAFGLNPAQYSPANAYVSLELLQRTLGREGRVNGILVAKDPAGRLGDVDALDAALKRHLTLDDLGTRLRTSPEHGYVSLEVDSFLMDPVIEAAALGAAKATGARAGRVLAYLATSIRKVDASAEKIAAADEALDGSDAISGASETSQATGKQAHPRWRKAGPDDVGGIPYSTVVGVEDAILATGDFHAIDGSLIESGIGLSGIILNEWAADALGAKPGDRIALTYDVTTPFGRLESRVAECTLQRVVKLEGGAADPGLVPQYKGITDAKRLTDWDPPFPVDLGRIGDADEAYWDAHRATPKAFVSLDAAIDLWAAQQDRFGRATAVRLFPPPSELQASARADSPSEPRASARADSPSEPRASARADVLPSTAVPRSLDLLAADFERAFLDRLDPARVGLSFQSARANALRAATGSTDFGGLFIGFSFFLIVSAALLVGLLFRLNVERRAAQVGLLLATGFPPRRVARLLLSEGAVLACIGSIIGLPGAYGFAWLMLTGLRTWWSAAVNAPVLSLHGTPASFIIGFSGSVLVAVASIAWSCRGLTRRSPRALLAGVVGESDSSDARRSVQDRAGDDKGAGESPHEGRHRTRRRDVPIMGIASLGIAAALALAATLWDAMPQAGAFFGSGALTLIGLLSLQGWRMRAARPAPIRTCGLPAAVRLGLRNAPRHRGRSLATVSLIASAAFLITALGAFRVDTVADVSDRNSGSGGFTWIAESATPIPFDLNTPEGRAAANLSTRAVAGLAGTTILSLRLRPGDESSCLNLYKPTRPRILGATAAMIQRGGFAFSSTMDPAGADSDADNPWTLLDHAFGDGAIPAIGDEAAVTWQLHSGLGEDFPIIDDRGRQRTLRFVALLTGSVLQSDIIVAEPHFTALFPSIGGYGAFLIAPPALRPAAPGQRAAGFSPRGLPGTDPTPKPPPGDPPSAAGADPSPPPDDLAALLESELAAWGFDAAPVAERLADYFAIQNTYLSTFQAMGGWGLLLGTAGLAAVMLRNVWERRGELALMRALGFPRSRLVAMILAENGLLVLAGLATGVLSALVAIAPQIATRAATAPWASLALMCAGVFAVGMTAGAIAARTAVRAPLLAALRTE